MKHLLTSLLLAARVGTGVLSATEPAPLPTASMVEVVEPHSLEIVFKGVKVGVRSFQAGDRYEVVRWSEHTVTLRQKNQIFTLPRFKVRPVGEGTMPPAPKVTVASPKEPAVASKPAAPQPPTTEPAATKSATSSSTQAVTAKTDLQALERYVTKANAFFKSQPTSARHARYSRMRELDPQALRQQMAGLLRDKTLGAEERAWVQSLQSAFIMYARGSWQAYESRIRQAATTLPQAS